MPSENRLPSDQIPKVVKIDNDNSMSNEELVDLMTRFSKEDPESVDGLGRIRNFLIWGVIVINTGLIAINIEPTTLKEVIGRYTILPFGLGLFIYGLVNAFTYSDLKFGFPFNTARTFP